MIAVKYLSPFQDHSGYASASRNFICALSFAGVDITTELIAQTPEKATYGWADNFTSALKDRNIDYKVKFLHVTPDLYTKYMEKGKYHIGHLFFETDQLPKAWVEPCNKMNEIWTASAQQAEMIKKSGVTVPIHFFPQPIDTSKTGRPSAPYKIANFEGTLFYSIFQWIERKNPKALLQTYWKTFTGKEDVGLLIKSYGVTYGENEFQRIKDDIKRWKEELNLPHYPKVFITKKLFSTDDIFRIHSTGDCFVTTSHGEGWQVPVAEAGLMGKPIIGIDKTGIFDYLPREDYYPCSTKEAKVVESPNIPWYESYMKWLDINEKDLSDSMLSVYNDKLLAKSKGLKVQEFVRENFNYNAVGMKMRQRLEEVYKFL
jgi:glycosyltransferase involved in cell wall biosynthesis